MSIISVDTISPRQSGVAVTVTGQCDVGIAITMDGTAGVITAKSFIGDGSSLTGMASTEYIDTASITVSGISTFTGAVSSAGALTVSNTTESTTKDTGAVIIDGGIGIEKNFTLGTTVKIDSGTGIVTATEFKGSGANLTGLPAGFDWLQGSLF